MGKRKRAPSPKENSEQTILSATNVMKVKCVTENKKADVLASENGLLEKELVEQATNYSSMTMEVGGDDRPAPQLRISARVQNKQRRGENTKIDFQQNKQKREDGSKTEGSSSSPLAKKMDVNSQDEDDDDDRNKDTAVMKKKRQIQHDGTKKGRRPWELWSMEDKNLFFEAINECGKDFESIQNFLLTKMRKKGIPTGVIKNRDQVRFFYYRTLHKISKFITLKEDVKKSTLELFTLINYGELRRKVGGTLNEKKALKLRELIQNGSASVRVRGKSIRIRTPVCRGLKKLNEFPDDRELGARVPVTVSVEVVPANLSSWNHVQSLAHNPRVRISCSMHKTLAAIIDHLQNKWRNTRHKICDSLISSATFALQPLPTSPKYLRLRPHNITSLNLVSIKPENQVKSFVISLSNHLELLSRARKSVNVPGSDPTCSSATAPPKGKECRTPRRRKRPPFVKEKPPSAPEDDNGTKKEEEEPPGEMSQEEPDEGSDIEIEDAEMPPSSALPIDSPQLIEDSPSGAPPTSNKVILIDLCQSTQPDPSNSSDVPNKPPTPSPPPLPTTQASLPLNPSSATKEEASFNLSPIYEDEVLTAVKNMKEEFTDSMETIHQLIALENVATSQEIEEDADVVCIGESTRLSAHGRQKHRRAEDANESAMAPPSSQSILEQEDGSAGGKTSPADSNTEEDKASVGYINDRNIHRVKQGWTSKTCGIITVGELYLMFGENKQITLEYDFEESENTEDSASSEASGLSADIKEDLEIEGIKVSQGPPKSAEITGQQDTTENNSPSLSPPTLTAPLSVNKPEAMDGSVLTQASAQKGEPPPPSTTSLPKSVSIDGDGLTSVGSPNPPSSESGNDLPTSVSSGSSDVTKDHKTVARDVSSMMAKLLHLIRLLSTKTGEAGNVGTSCVCGANPAPPRNTINSLKSPSGRGCLNGLFRSPGASSKSPRGCSVSVKSPRTPTMPTSTAGDSTNSKVEKTKPTSAKRLMSEPFEKISSPSAADPNHGMTPITDKQPEAPRDKTDGGSRESLNTVVDSTGSEFRLPVGPAPRNPACQTPNQSFNAQLSLLRRYSRRARRSVRKNMVVQRQLPLLPRLPKDSPGFVALKIGNLQQFTVSTPMPQLSVPLSLSGSSTISSMPQAIDSAPAPANLPSQQVLAPVFVPQPISLVPEPFPKEMKLPDISGAGTNAISVNVSGQQLLTVRMPTCPPASTSTVTSASTTTMATITSTVPSSLTSPCPVTSVTPLLSSSNCVATVTETTSFQQFNASTTMPQLSVPLSLSGSSTISSIPQAIDSAPAPVDLSSQQVLAPVFVPEPFSEEMKLPHIPGAGTNAISVNVSGQQLLTVRMPTCPPASTSTVTSASTTTMTTITSTIPSSLTSLCPVTSVTALTSSSKCVTTVTETTTACALSISSVPMMSTLSTKRPTAADTTLTALSHSLGYSFNNFLSPAIGDNHYLTTPPSTPVGPANKSHLENLLNTPSSASKPEFDTFITSNSTNLLSMEELEMAAFSSPLKTSQEILGPPSTVCESSLLSTPRHINLPSGPTNRLVDADVSPIKLNLSAFLASPATSHSPEKTLDSIIQQPSHSVPLTSTGHLPASQSPLPIQQSATSGPVTAPQTVENDSLIPQIHIQEEANDDLPILDISMGGTISVQQREAPTIVVSTGVEALSGFPPAAPPLSTNCTGILSGLSVVTPDACARRTNMGVSSVSAPDSTHPVTGVSASSSALSCGRVNVLEESLLHPFQESNDKMLDIALVNSNSNSCFSGLLAAAAHQPTLEALVLENSLLQTPPRPMLSSTSANVAAAAEVKTNLTLDAGNFGGLSGTVPLSPPSSPSRLLNQVEAQWMMNTELNDFSLSRLLGSIESSPQKGPAISSLLPPPSPAAPDLRSSFGSRSFQTNLPSCMLPSQKKMQALISCLNDNSVDFTATFDQLKHQQTKDKSE